MRRSATVIAGALAAFTALVGLAAGPAQAATGQVVVFSTELQPLDIYQNPTGCQKLPPLSHVVDNLTDSTIRVWADPFCTIPASLPGTAGGVGTLAAGYGTHVSGVGSFSA